MKKSKMIAAGFVVSSLILSSCGGDDSSSSSSEAASTGVTEAPTDSSDDPLDALYQECLDNGAQVNLIALPDEWANYKGILQSFRDKYPGVENPVASPDASSAEEMEAIQGGMGLPPGMNIPGFG